jgi:hypothetical protein
LWREKGWKGRSRKEEVVGGEKLEKRKLGDWMEGERLKVKENRALEGGYRKVWLWAEESLRRWRLDGRKKTGGKVMEREKGGKLGDIEWGRRTNGWRWKLDMRVFISWEGYLKASLFVTL